MESCAEGTHSLFSHVDNGLIENAPHNLNKESKDAGSHKEHPFEGNVGHMPSLLKEDVYRADCVEESSESCQHAENVTNCTENNNDMLTNLGNLHSHREDGDSNMLLESRNVSYCGKDNRLLELIAYTPSNMIVEAVTENVLSCRSDKENLTLETVAQNPGQLGINDIESEIVIETELQENRRKNIGSSNNVGPHTEILSNTVKGNDVANIACINSMDSAGDQKTELQREMELYEAAEREEQARFLFTHRSDQYMGKSCRDTVSPMNIQSEQKRAHKTGLTRQTMKCRRKDEASHWEDVCFVCHDGGELILCERRSCLKAYHVECTGRDSEFFEEKRVWFCDWHSCTYCSKPATVQCYTCPIAFCLDCIMESDFLCVRKNKGLCASCLLIAEMIECSKTADADGVHIDFNDDETYEYFYKFYWEDLKNKISLAWKEVKKAQKAKKTGKNLLKRGSNDTECVPLVNDGSDIDLDVPMIKHQRQLKRKKLIRPSFLADDESKSDYNAEDGEEDGIRPKKGRTKGHEFNGWATRELLDFLQLKKDDRKRQLPLSAVNMLLCTYIENNKLQHPLQRGQIVCDEKLQKLFGKRRVGRSEMTKLLSSHLAPKRQNFRDNREIRAICDDNIGINHGEEIWAKGPSKKPSRNSDEINNSKADPNDFAAINIANINLIYLTRDLLEDLLGDPKFNDMVIGAFVRIRVPGALNKKDAFYRLVQVVGTRLSDLGILKRRPSDVVLEILNLQKREEFAINLISNQDFTEEECKRLRQSIKCGVINAITVGELERKAKSLQEAKDKAWFDSEFVRLSHLRDRASEKGHRKELREYVEKLQLLSDPEERARRLMTPLQITADPHMDPDLESDAEDKSSNDKKVPEDLDDLPVSWEEGNITGIWSDNVTENVFNQRETRRNSCFNEVYLPSDPVMSYGLDQQSGGCAVLAKAPEKEKIWHYQDPAGKIQGPFSMEQLRKWEKTKLFPLDLKIWKTSDFQTESFFLMDALAGKICKNLSQPAVATKDYFHASSIEGVFSGDLKVATRSVPRNNWRSQRGGVGWDQNGRVCGNSPQPTIPSKNYFHACSTNRTSSRNMKAATTRSVPRNNWRLQPGVIGWDQSRTKCSSPASNANMTWHDNGWMTNGSTNLHNEQCAHLSNLEANCGQHVETENSEVAGSWGERDQCWEPGKVTDAGALCTGKVLKTGEHWGCVKVIEAGGFDCDSVPETESCIVGALGGDKGKETGSWGAGKIDEIEGWGSRKMLDTGGQGSEYMLETERLGSCKVPETGGWHSRIAEGNDDGWGHQTDTRGWEPENVLETGGLRSGKVSATGGLCPRKVDGKGDGWGHHKVPDTGGWGPENVLETGGLGSGKVLETGSWSPRKVEEDSLGRQKVPATGGWGAENTLDTVGLGSDKVPETGGWCSWKVKENGDGWGHHKMLDSCDRGLENILKTGDWRSKNVLEAEDSGSGKVCETSGLSHRKAEYDGWGCHNVLHSGGWGPENVLDTGGLGSGKMSETGGWSPRKVEEDGWGHHKVPLSGGWGPENALETGVSGSSKVPKTGGSCSRKVEENGDGWGHHKVLDSGGQRPKNVLETGDLGSSKVLDTGGWFPTNVEEDDGRGGHKVPYTHGWGPENELETGCLGSGKVLETGGLPPRKVKEGDARGCNKVPDTHGWGSENALETGGLGSGKLCETGAWSPEKVEEDDGWGHHKVLDSGGWGPENVLENGDLGSSKMPKNGVWSHRNVEDDGWGRHKMPDTQGWGPENVLDTGGLGSGKLSKTGGWSCRKVEEDGSGHHKVLHSGGCRPVSVLDTGGLGSGKLSKTGGWSHRKVEEDDGWGHHKVLCSGSWGPENVLDTGGLGSGKLSKTEGWSRRKVEEDDGWGHHKVLRSGGWGPENVLDTGSLGSGKPSETGGWSHRKVEEDDGWGHHKVLHSGGWGPENVLDTGGLGSGKLSETGGWSHRKAEEDDSWGHHKVLHSGGWGLENVLDTGGLGSGKLSETGSWSHRKVEEDDWGHHKVLHSGGWGLENALETGGLGSSNVPETGGWCSKKVEESDGWGCHKVPPHAGGWRSRNVEENYRWGHQKVSRFGNSHRLNFTSGGTRGKTPFRRNHA